MLPLILGLMCDAEPVEISRLMDETTKRHQEAADELRKKEEARKEQIKYERERFDELFDDLYEELEKYEFFVGSENMQERLLYEVENVCYTLKIDRVLFFEELLKNLKIYYD